MCLDIQRSRRIRLWPDAAAQCGGGIADRAGVLAQEAIEARHKTWLGRSTVRTLRAGNRFTLTQAPLPALNDPHFPGFNVLDLKSDGVGYAMDENNAALVTPEMLTAVDAAAAKIKSGELVVHDYMSDDTCPAATF